MFHQYRITYTFDGGIVSSKVILAENADSARTQFEIHYSFDKILTVRQER